MQVGRFWRYLLQNFPETIDFLATVEPEYRDHFNVFVEVRASRGPIGLNSPLTDPILPHQSSTCSWRYAPLGGLSREREREMFTDFFKPGGFLG